MSIHTEAAHSSHLHTYVASPAVVDYSDGSTNDGDALVFYNGDSEYVIEGDLVSVAMQIIATLTAAGYDLAAMVPNESRAS